MASKDIERERRRLEKLAAKKGVECYNDFYFFFKEFWPLMSGEQYIDNWHVKLICDVLQEYGTKIARGEVLRKTIVINVPPGSSKSTIATVAFPLWMWLRKPSCTTVNISFSAELSKDHQELSKQIPSSEKWKVLFDKIMRLKHGRAIEIVTSNKIKVQNNFGGKRFNTSVGGSITGRHADIIIEDDPLDPERAFSDAERETAIRFHDKTVSSRKKNDNCYLNIIIAQRLHEEDVPGHVLKKNLDITHICLPGEITPSTIVMPESARKFYVDGVLNPIRKGKEVLRDLEASMGSDAYTTQVLQLPFDLDKQDITPSMFEIIDGVPDDVVFDVWVDGAFTEKTENDPSGIDLIARYRNDIIVKQSYDVRKKLPDLLKFIVELESTGLFDKNKSRIFIEPKASGSSLADYIESDTEYNFVRIGEHNKQERKLVNTGKKARHEMIKPKAESHRIKLVKGNWNDDFIVQICGFPRAAHDEHVDNLGYAINHYYMNENSFIASHAMTRLERNASDSIPINITALIDGYRIATSYEENDKGDVRLFDYPKMTHSYRYICVLALRSESERGGNTSIVVIDRTNLEVCCLYESNTINANKAGKKAIAMANMYDKAKLVVAVKKESGSAQGEDNDLSHIAITEIRSTRYENIFSRLKVNDIRKKREREYGFEVGRSGSREVYYHLKEMAETSKIKVVPLEVFEDMKNIERKKETGEIAAREGYQTNTALAFAIALKVHDEMYDKVCVRKLGNW